MQIYIVGVLLCIPLLLIYFYRRKPRGVVSYKISSDKVGDVYKAISEQAVETSFSVFVMPRLNQDPVEVQFSIENGQAGLDWILESEPNKEQRPQIERYLSAKGFDYEEKEMNNWHYLRVENGDLVQLCVGIIRDVYHSDEVILKFGGFRFRRKR